MEFHPHAEIFPLLDDPLLDDLAEDIRVHGLQCPIWLFEGKILDGRNRYIACQRSGIAPTYQDYGGDDPIGFVVSLNLHRRHLDTNQRAMAGARVIKQYEAAAKERMLAGKRADPTANLPEGTAESREQAAALFDVSPRSVQSARRVIKYGTPELVAAVDEGKLAVSAAEKMTTLAPERQAELIVKGDLATATEESRKAEYDRRNAMKRKRSGSGRNTSVDQDAAPFSSPPTVVANQGAAQTPDPRIDTDISAIEWLVRKLIKDAEEIREKANRLCEYVDKSGAERAADILWNTVQKLNNTLKAPAANLHRKYSAKLDAGRF